MTEPLFCAVYRSRRTDGLYLFLPKDAELSTVPDAVMRQFGTPELAMTIELTADRKLARSDAREVLANIARHGFHIQLPPRDSELP